VRRVWPGETLIGHAALLDGKAAFRNAVSQRRRRRTQPEPAAVMAFDGMRVRRRRREDTSGWCARRVRHAQATSSISSWRRKIAVLGWWPIARKTPWQGNSVTSPVRVSRSRTARTPASLAPSTSTTSLCQRHSIFGLASAFSCMIFDARSSPRRWTTVTLLANFVK
jgi:hypothetical protein